MREIKFRQRMPNGEWHYWGFLRNRDGAVYFVTPAHSNTALKDSDQFTGLSDKNGVQIYEGDITNNGIVEWCEYLNWDGGGSKHPGFYFKDRYEDDERGALSYHDRLDGDIEVIGNKWENPELLEGANDGNLE